MSRRIALPFLLLGHMLLGPVPSEALCAFPFPVANATQAFSAIRIVPAGDNFSIAAGTSTALNAAIARWNTVCGSKVPTLSKTASSAIKFTVRFMKGTYNLDGETDACAATTTPPTGQTLGSGTIYIFERTRAGADCTPVYSEITMHEIGHRLGLNHSPCSDNIMRAANLAGLTASVADCNAVDTFWLSTAELPPPPFPPICECSFASDCTNLYGDPSPGTWSCQFFCQCLLLNSPLVLHLPDYFGSGGQRSNWWQQGFCGQEAPRVCLDWSGDGSVSCTGWTDPQSEIAFIVALSEDDMLRVAGGIHVPAQPWRHFFGNVTMGPDGGFPYAHGFEALAAYCGKDPKTTSRIDFIEESKTKEGAEHGEATSIAECLESLHVWADHNSDGVMAPEELLELQDLGIESLGNVRKTGKRDKCGNTFPVESHATCSGRPGEGPCGLWLDVFFVPRF